MHTTVPKRRHALTDTDTQNSICLAHQSAKKTTDSYQGINKLHELNVSFYDYEYNTRLFNEITTNNH